MKGTLRENDHMVTRIGPTKPGRNFLREWREKAGLTQQQLADRVGTGKDQISRWERGGRGMTFDVQLALAEALNIDPADLFRDPARPSIDALLRNASDAVKEQAYAIVLTLLKTSNR